MTRFEIEVAEIVVRGLVRPEDSEGLAPLVERRLAQLARGEEPDSSTPLADLVADGIWAEVRRSTTGLGLGS